jgi:GT2 family glycosyltransferase
MNSEPILSIVAVVIDNLEVSKRFISSIRQYTTGSYKLILIDNGSKDSSASQYYKDSADIYFKFEKITDLAKAWNKGIELSKGKFVAIVNNDTIVPKRWNEALIDTLQNNERAGMVTPLTYWIIAGHSKYKMYKNWNLDFKNPKPFILEKFKDMVWGEFCIFKRTVLEEIGGYNEIYKKLHAEDLEMAFQLFNRNYDIYVDPRVFVYHEGGASHITDIRPNKELEQIKKENYELFKSRWPEQTKYYD